MALLHTQQRDDQGPSIPVLPTLGFGRHSPVHGVRASKENASTLTGGSASTLFDATSRCYRLGRFANRSSHPFKSQSLAGRGFLGLLRCEDRFAGMRCDIDRHPILKSQRQSPERPSGFSVILRGRKRSLSPVTFASLLTSPGRGRRAVPSTVADGNCRGAHVAASALLFGLSHVAGLSAALNSGRGTNGTGGTGE